MQRAIAEKLDGARISAAEIPETATVESVLVAREAGLVWVTDTTPGIRRVRRGKGFSYVSPEGKRLTDARTLGRITRLAIPPAWTDVWICPLEHGHIQATGRDARGRKQYRYHPSWREHRDEVKFQQLLAFGRALPAIRRTIARDLAQPGITRTKVLAALVRLLEATLIRVGNEEYAKANASYGLTTLLDHHAHVRGQKKVTFQFRGKSGIERVLTLEDPQLARVVKRSQDLPGQTLFQYVDEEGSQKKVGSGDVNDYLRELSGTELTAKYFRTWGGTLVVMCQLADAPPPRSQRDAKKVVNAAIAHAAELLGNTVAVCRRYYVHPAIIEAWSQGWLGAVAGRATCEGRRWRTDGLSPRERGLVAVLERAEREAARRPALVELLAKSVTRRAQRPARPDAKRQRPTTSQRRHARA